MILRLIIGIALEIRLLRRTQILVRLHHVLVAVLGKLHPYAGKFGTLEDSFQVKVVAVDSRLHDARRSHFLGRKRVLLLPGRCRRSDELVFERLNRDSPVAVAVFPYILVSHSQDFALGAYALHRERLAVPGELHIIPAVCNNLVLVIAFVSQTVKFKNTLRTRIIVVVTVVVPMDGLRQDGLVSAVAYLVQLQP